MRLAIIGATGATGQALLQQALAAGHHVHALVRRPEAIASHDRVQASLVDVLDRDSLGALQPGTDAVIVATGARTREPTTFYSTGLANVMQAMEIAGVRRLVALSAAGLETSSELPALERLLLKAVVQPMLRHPYADLARMERLVRQSRLDWTLLRAPRLTNGPHTGRYRMAIDSHLTQRGVSRPDVADCALHCLADPRTIRAVVELAY